MNDVVLARRVLAGDEAAFDEFFGRYFQRLYRFALPRLGGNDDAAEEVVQRVLIRAIEPLHGIETMCERRGLHDVRLLCAGPGRVGEALAIVHAYNGHRLDQKPFEVFAADRDYDVAVGPRIGISKAADVPWRFGMAGSVYLSRRFPAKGPVGRE